MRIIRSQFPAVCWSPNQWWYYTSSPWHKKAVWIKIIIIHYSLWSLPLTNIPGLLLRNLEEKTCVVVYIYLISKKKEFIPHLQKISNPVTLDMFSFYHYNEYFVRDGELGRKPISWRFVVLRSRNWRGPLTHGPTEPVAIQPAVWAEDHSFVLTFTF